MLRYKFNIYLLMLFYCFLLFLIFILGSLFLSCSDVHIYFIFVADLHFFFSTKFRLFRLFRLFHQGTRKCGESRKFALYGSYSERFSASGQLYRRGPGLGAYTPGYLY